MKLLQATRLIILVCLCQFTAQQEQQPQGIQNVDAQAQSSKEVKGLDGSYERVNDGFGNVFRTEDDEQKLRHKQALLDENIRKQATTTPTPEVRNPVVIPQPNQNLARFVRAKVEHRERLQETEPNSQKQNQEKKNVKETQQSKKPVAKNLQEQSREKKFDEGNHSESESNEQTSAEQTTNSNEYNNNNNLTIDNSNENQTKPNIDANSTDASTNILSDINQSANQSELSEHDTSRLSSNQTETAQNEEQDLQQTNVAAVGNETLSEEHNATRIADELLMLAIDEQLSLDSNNNDTQSNGTSSEEDNKRHKLLDLMVESLGNETQVHASNTTDSEIMKLELTDNVQNDTSVEFGDDGAVGKGNATENVHATDDREPPPVERMIGRMDDDEIAVNHHKPKSHKKVEK